MHVTIVLVVFLGVEEFFASSTVVTSTLAVHNSGTLPFQANSNSTTDYGRPAIFCEYESSETTASTYA
jgi:hypothetical protein